MFQRFGAVSDQYDGLFWSHFQAGLDWDDAEMWLEGAILNGWSVSQMRGKRWEALGNAGAPPADELSAPFDEDASASEEGEAASSSAGSMLLSAASTIKKDPGTLLRPCKMNMAGRVKMLKGLTPNNSSVTRFSNPASGPARIM